MAWPRDHDREVAQRRHVRRSGGRGAEQRADLGNATREGDLVVEDVAPRVASGVAVELLVDASAGGVDEVHERRADLVGELLHARDLLERAPAPRAGLHRVVVGDDARRATVDRADGGDHGVAGQAVLGSGRAVRPRSPVGGRRADAMRSRTSSWPLARTRSRALSEPPRRATSRRRRSSSLGPSSITSVASVTSVTCVLTDRPTRVRPSSGRTCSGTSSRPRRAGSAPRTAAR